MFKKKPAIKPLAPLRSSEKRKVADKIIEQYKIKVLSENDVAGANAGASAGVAAPADEQPSAPSTATANLSTVRSGLLPEGVVSGRFQTTVGPKLKPVLGTIYAGSFPGEEERILWFRLDQGPGADERFYPTVYTLWRHPSLIPLLHTPPMVMEKLYNGADLMIPGLVGGPPFPLGAVKGAIVALASTDKPTVPTFVGICEIDISSLGEVYRQKGHAVKGMQWLGDELWSWGPPGKAGKLAPDHIDGWSHGRLFLEDAEAPNDALQGLSLEEPQEKEVEVEAPLGAKIDQVERVQIPELTAQDIDKAFIAAFLFHIHKQMNTHSQSPTHDISFPILPTTLIANIVTPYLPIRTAEEAQYYNIKKTSWKTVKKFIKHLHKQKLVHSKDRNGGETVILDIDFSHRMVQEFVPYKLPKTRTQAQPLSESTGAAGQSGGQGSAASTSGQNLNVLVLYKPVQKLTPDLFPPLSSTDRRNYYSSSDISKRLNEYLAAEEPPIISKSNPRLITLNSFIANNIFSSTHREDEVYLSRGVIYRDVLLKRLISDPSLLVPHYALVKPGQAPQDAKIKPGLGPKVTITLQRRTGNKVVTKITGFEPFAIDASSLAEELQRKCASSSTTNKLTKDTMEVLVQGDQKKAVQQALAERGVKAQWLELIDKTQKKKAGY
ncbi:hypothetical protein KEM54_004899 [Ascosphaera aggregata]|nr:hypothetical protein KEM54_004899 [Ascosphaera aggregata]